MSVLEVTVGVPIERKMERFGTALQAAMEGGAIMPHFGVGFANMAQFGDVFTPKRWELIKALKAAGPLSIYALAKRLGRHYRNVHKDVSALMEWMVIEKDASGHIYVPWDEIDVRLPLTTAA
ncbi:MAG: HVO_A0114 family putative DNA-binding protein [Acidithiobacillus sp.]